MHHPHEDLLARSISPGMVDTRPQLHDMCTSLFAPHLLLSKSCMLQCMPSTREPQSRHA